MGRMKETLCQECTQYPCICPEPPEYPWACPCEDGELYHCKIHGPDKVEGAKYTPNGDYIEPKSS
jgi:hypothetical protein